jgi:glycosyltransferase 2 family protein
MNRARKHAYSILRWLFFLISLAYLARFAYTSFDFGALAQGFTLFSGIRLSLAALLFAATAMFSVLGWRVLLKSLGYARPFVPVAHAFCVTQIAKYLPGNVGHHVGRVAIAQSQLGIPTGTSLISILQESALACLGAFLISAIGVLASPSGSFPSLRQDVWAGSGISFATALSAILLVGVLALAIVNHFRHRPPFQEQRLLRWLAGAAPAWSTVRSALPPYVAIYVVNGFALWLIAGSLMDVSAADFLILAGAYSLSWAAGFLLPGAPGGLGVREAALAMLLSGSYAPDSVFLLSILSRVATVLADLVIFLFGLAWSGRTWTR